MAEAYKSSTSRAVLEKFTGRAGAQPDSEDSAIRDAFDDARPRSREDLMLDVRLKDGSCCALGYQYLYKAKYHKGDLLTLFFGEDRVVIEGRNLRRLHESIRQHKAKYVQEGTIVEDDLKPEDAPHIESIRIEEETL